MSPDDYIVIDKTLYPTRGVILFTTYNKEKPAQYGLNFRSRDSLGVLTFIIQCHIPGSQ